MADYLEIGVGRQDAHPFTVGRDEDGPFVFVRGTDAPRFEVARTEDYLQVGAAPPVVRVTEVTLDMYVVHPDDFSLTLRGDFDLHRMSGGEAVETIVEGHEWVWRFSPVAAPYTYRNLVSDGQTVAFVWRDGIGPLQPSTDYRMTIYWMSQTYSSYNALQTVDFTTNAGGDYAPPYFVKRIASEAPEW